MIKRVFISNTFDAYQNIAIEKELSLKYPLDITLFLWQNNRTVVIGKNQNPYRECNLTFMKENKITLTRRFSGGGAVYHDLGNLNYTLIMPETKFNMEDVKQLLVSMSLKLGFKPEFTGKNDIVYQNKKFSGHAYFVEDNTMVFHGTLMIDLDISILSKCLTPSIMKLNSKGIDSVKSRVLNLKDVLPKLTVIQVQEALIESFEDVYKNISMVDFIEPLDTNHTLVSNLQSEAWLFGETPLFDVTLEKHFEFGTVTVKADIKDNRICKIKIYSDSLRTSWTHTENALLDEFFSEEIIWNRIKKIA